MTVTFCSVLQLLALTSWIGRTTTKKRHSNVLDIFRLRIQRRWNSDDSIFVIIVHLLLRPFWTDRAIFDISILILYIIIYDIHAYILYLNQRRFIELAGSINFLLFFNYIFACFQYIDNFYFVHYDISRIKHKSLQFLYWQFCFHFYFECMRFGDLTHFLKDTTTNNNNNNDIRKFEKKKKRKWNMLYVKSRENVEN